MSFVGEYFHTNGPLVLASDATRKAMMKSLSETDRKAIKSAGTKKAPIVPIEIGGKRAYVLPGSEHTAVKPLDGRAVMLVRRNGYFNPVLELDKVMQYEPGWTTEPWKTLDLVLEVPRGGLVLFDAMAQYPDKKNPSNNERGVPALAAMLPPGKFVIEHVPQQKFARNFAVSLLYIHPADHRPALSAQDEKPGVPAPLVIDKATAAAAKKLKFVESEGGPLIFMPERVLKEWRGIETKDYDRACGVRGAVGPLSVGSATAIVLTTPDSTAACQHDKDLLLLRWVGADHAAALLAAATGPGKYKKTKTTIESKGETWVLFDSGDDGQKLKKSSGSRIELPKGRYRVDEMDEWNGDVVLAGEKSEVMATAVRLTRS